MSLPTTGSASAAVDEMPALNDWNDTIRLLEHALTVGDAEQVASIAVSVTNGPIPAAMVARAEAVLDGLGRLEDDVTRRLASIASELDRIPSRSRWARPPAPSQLDCSA